MLRDILLNHAWSLFNHSELSLLEESLKALPWDSLLENPQLVLLPGVADAKPASLRRS